MTVIDRGKCASGLLHPGGPLLVNRHYKSVRYFPDVLSLV